ncbi:preprotein translocase subunit SecG [Sneathiella sp. CAU 1612]|jgi:preprotein translocase subunit SecG|uniref:Protein-export membrane protein SecG n=1 Tax=Sneathiella sedimenti TaxID=2816034 RepID=A0ABS3F8Z0_9PROT|nr:preprotein translocase subunit SecG [Sneathiella sedimenti]MBO0334979.1 preprotein translocase subunit SecG [Sneathiella sedimenti]
METVLLVIHVMIAIFLIGVVLLQRSEGGALGIGGGGGGAMSSRGAANLLTRTTAGLAAAFMLTSVLLAIVSGTHSEPTSILDTPATTEAPANGAPAVPAVPAEPTAPLSE